MGLDFTSIRLIGLYTIDLPIVDLDPTASYILKAADGLGPPSVSPRIAQGRSNGKIVADREIVIRVELQPDYTVGEKVSDLRDGLYGLLTPGVSDEVEVQLLDGATVVATVKGQAKNPEINPFSTAPEMQITISCYTPYLSAPASTLVATPPNKLFPVVLNEGSAPAGFTMEVNFIDTRGWWFFTRGDQKMRFDYPFINGDILKFSTQYGNRYVRLERAGVTTNILKSLSFDSTWIQLHGGLNTFTANTVQYTWGPIRYTPQYWGI